jgi:homoserine dehydrogenase
MHDPLRIGLAGLGTVGSGIVRIVQENAACLAARAGRPVEITAISARSRSRNRGVDVSGYAWEDDPVALARRDDVDLVVEVIGGEDGPAKATAEAAIASGKHVVTANKAMLARHGQRLAEAAEERGVALRFEAAVAGGIPVVKALVEGLAANRITRVMGVLNGTCNYILTEMERTGAAYGQVLEAAQKLGYAEADPSIDVGGVDAAQKLALLSAAAFGTRVDFEAMSVEGIERVSLADIEHAAELGYRIKLLGVARLTPRGLETRMQPCLVPSLSPVGTLEGVTNMVVLEGDFVGRIVMSGPGAGAGADRLGHRRRHRRRGARAGLPGLRPARRAPSAPRRGRARAGRPPITSASLLDDRPGTLAKVAAALGESGISIDRMRQVAHEGDVAPVLIVTHRTRRGALDAALDSIGGLAACRDAPVAIRIEDV